MPIVILTNRGGLKSANFVVVGNITITLLNQFQLLEILLPVRTPCLHSILKMRPDKSFVNQCEQTCVIISESSLDNT